MNKINEGQGGQNRCNTGEKEITKGKQKMNMLEAKGRKSFK